MKKTQTKADMMEKLSRSLQTERNTLKDELKHLKEKFCPQEEVPVAMEAAAAESEKVTETTEEQQVEPTTTEKSAE